MDENGNECHEGVEGEMVVEVSPNRPVGLFTRYVVSCQGEKKVKTKLVTTTTTSKQKKDIQKKESDDGKHDEKVIFQLETQGTCNKCLSSPSLSS